MLVPECTAGLSVVDVLRGNKEASINLVPLVDRKTVLAFTLGQMVAFGNKGNKLLIRDFLNKINTIFPINVTDLQIIANRTYDYYSMLLGGDTDLIFKRNASPFLLITAFPHMELFSLLAKYHTENNLAKIEGLKNIYEIYRSSILTFIEGK